MFHYTSCGLNNVWLANGYREKRTPHGKAVAIEALADLHRAIAQYLIAYRPHLTGSEFRFLRIELGLSQGELAKLLGNEEQTVSLWERRGRVPVTADRMLRALYREHRENAARLWEMLRRLAGLEEQPRRAKESAKVTFEETSKGWEPKPGKRGPYKPRTPKISIGKELRP